MVSQVRAQADDRIEIFDAHLHYNWEPRPHISLDQVLKLFRDNKVTGILATSRPNDGTHALMESKAPELQVVPFIRPYRVRSDISSWFSNPTIFDLVREEFQRGYYRGIGEFHLSGRAAASDGVKKAVNFAVEHDLYLHAHGDDEMVEMMMAHNAKAKIIWAHTGFGLPSERVAELLVKYPHLWGELSYRSGIIGGDGKLTDEWRDLFMRYPDRFLIGSDTWINERWSSYSAIMAQYRGWLSQLPKEVANKIANGNARTLFGVSTRR
jgi:Amidohydrolase